MSYLYRNPPYHHHPHLECTRHAYNANTRTHTHTNVNTHTIADYTVNIHTLCDTKIVIWQRYRNDLKLKPIYKHIAFSAYVSSPWYNFINIWLTLCLFKIHIWKINQANNEGWMKKKIALEICGALLFT